MTIIQLAGLLADTGHLTGLHHGSVLLLEALVDALGALHELVEAAVNASLFFGDERLGGEVVDAVIEAASDDGRVDLRFVSYCSTTLA